MKKSSRGFMSYVILIASFLLIAVLLNNGLGLQENKRIEYPELLQMIQQDQVAKVAVSNSTLVGLKKNSTVAQSDFPDRKYDFETTIGADFIDTVRQMEAQKRGVSLESVSLNDLGFTVEYIAPVVTPWYIDFLPFLLIS
ncbi:MAG: ATP-dependent metallopeptidase FtsH/Yme1/Tma family protein, partial [Clostridia bacterium]|nr:ATP-dependent metallopeptidase FtsH/Yme1/Tma family protein [Clostridia bacterium]